MGASGPSRRSENDGEGDCGCSERDRILMLSVWMVDLDEFSVGLGIGMTVSKFAKDRERASERVE